MTTPHTVPLDAADAWQLLRSRSVGRLAVSVGDRPDIFPVNFLARRDALLVRTGIGTKTARIAVNPHVAFEVDHWTADHAWSVVVHGQARLLDEEDDAAAIAGLLRAPLWAWAPEAKHSFLRITASEITGRRFTRH